MKKLSVLLIMLCPLLGFAVSPAFAGDKVRGDDGLGSVEQVLCDLTDECAATPYWWD